MQKWEYAQVHAHWDQSYGERDFYIQYYDANGAKVESPPMVKQGKREVLPPNKECWGWFNSKIAELGQEGWEMVSAPTLSFSGYSRDTEWVLWFKRPVP